MPSVPEKDWKLFRKLEKDMLSRVCETIFEKVDALSDSRKGNEHDSYIKLYQLIQEEDQLIAAMFNNPTRNNALFKVVELKLNNILKENEFSQFSEETQKHVLDIIELRRSSS